MLLRHHSVYSHKEPERSTVSDTSRKQSSASEHQSHTNLVDHFVEWLKARERDRRRALLACDGRLEDRIERRLELVQESQVRVCENEVES